jgi:hypothetical protein
VEHASDLNRRQQARTAFNCTTATCARVCFCRSAHLPGLTGSQRVRGSNPLSSTPSSWILKPAFLLVVGFLADNVSSLIRVLNAVAGSIVVAL